MTCTQKFAIQQEFGGTLLVQELQWNRKGFANVKGLAVHCCRGANGQKGRSRFWGNLFSRRAQGSASLRGGGARAHCRRHIISCALPFEQVNSLIRRRQLTPLKPRGKGSTQSSGDIGGHTLPREDGHCQFHHRFNLRFLGNRFTRALRVRHRGGRIRVFGFQG